MTTKNDVVTFLDPATEDAIEQELGYGDSKSEWIRKACEQRLERIRNQRIEQ